MSRISRTLEAMSAVSMIVASIAVVWVVVKGPQVVQVAQAGRDNPSAVESMEPTTVDIGLNIRQRKAKLVVVEFSDFECPYCGRYARDVLPAIERDFVNTGKVEYVFKHFPLESIHPNAAAAAAAAECAGRQGRLREMYHRVFSNQKALTAPDLLAHALAVGVGEQEFRACMSSDSPQLVVRGDLELGQDLGVNSTPTFFIGTIQEDGRVTLVKKLKGARPFEAFNDALSALL